MAQESQRKLGEVVTDALLEMLDRRERQRAEPRNGAMPSDGGSGGGLLSDVALEHNTELSDRMEGLSDRDPGHGLPGCVDELR